MSTRIALVLAVLFWAPAAASWNIEGSREPDTPHDRAWMYVEADASPDPGVRRVYFNAIAQQGVRSPLDLPWGARTNPNQLDGGRIAPVGALEVVAYLGVWKDCNRDGHVGAASSALWYYPSDVLDPDDVCPPGSPYNQEGWVWEFLWIRPTENASSQIGPPRALVDSRVLVWGDYGLPGPVQGGPPACSVKPMANGTLSRTGGLLRVSDCQSGFLFAKTLATHAPDGPPDLAFDDPYHPERDCDHPLNRPVGLWADPHPCPGDRAPRLAPGAPPLARAWDCEGVDRYEALRDPTAPPGGRGPYSRWETPPVALPDRTVWGQEIAVGGDEGTLLVLPVPGSGFLSPRADPDGSLYAAWDEAVPGAMTCGRVEHAPVSINGTTVKAQPIRNLTSAWWMGFLNPALRLYGLEGDHPPEDPRVAKRETDFPLTYYDAGSFRATLSPHAGFWTPTLAGQRTAGQGWRTAGPIHGPPQYRGQLLEGDGEAQGAVHLTFYARLGEATLAVASHPGRASAYGAEACDGHDSGVHGGWDCNPDAWWDPSTGGQPAPKNALVARVGDVYHLRDVDCFDGSLFQDGPRASLADISTEGACPQPFDGPDG